MKQACRDLIQQGKEAFQRKLPFDSMCQDIAENFYPERATFTRSHIMGEEFATHLYSSYPLLMRRELGDALSTLSRPAGENWFYMGLVDEDREDQAAKQWMEHKTGILRRHMYSPNSGFSRSTKAGDHEWATFGQCALSAELNRSRNGLFYRIWPLENMAWEEGYTGNPELFWRKWEPSVRQLKQIFGKDRLHKSCQDEKDQGKKVRCMHIFVPSECYEGATPLFPYISIYVDLDNEHEIEVKGLPYGYYVVPRWFTPPGSQYAYSPAIIAALPDARLYQDMTRVILEAGQKAVDPPLIGVAEAIGSDIDIQAGGFTAVSAEYDERLGEVLRPLFVDKSGLPLGMDLLDRTQQVLAKALYIDKLTLPRNFEMTATESQIRFQEYIRTILPLFEPKEAEMEARICQLGFDILFRHGAFGSIKDMPPSLQGADYQFRFISPLSRAIEQKKTNIFYEVKNVLAQAAEVEPLVIANIDINTAARDAMVGAGADADWLIDEEQVMEAQQAAREQQQAQKEMEMTQQAKELISVA